LAPVLPEAAPSSRRRWSGLGIRVLSALVLAPVVLGCLWFSEWTWIALIAVVTIGLAAEWLGLCRHRPAAWLVPAGVLYILPAVVSVLWLRADPLVGRSNMLFVLLIVWASDIGAFLVGRLVGGAKLAPAISPGKTWSGAAGGLAGAVLVGLLAGESWQAAAVAAGLSLLEQAGDLFESSLKRHFGVKDSGRLIPGHGGLFDRLDGLLIAAPAACLLGLVLGPGVELWR
jgi:phosphatidate cytidylyltransferase